jgi:GNAT superfamily N-acetyltransferase
MLRIRDAHSRDLDELGRIELETARAFAPGVLRPHLVKPMPPALLHGALTESLLWVADFGPRGVVGFVLAQRHGASLHIGELDVRPDFGHRGIGTALVVHVSAVAKRLGLRFVTLTTLRHVPWNAPFYGRLGFTPVADLRPFRHLQRALRHERRIGLRGSVAMSRTPGTLSRLRGVPAQCQPRGVPPRTSLRAPASGLESAGLLHRTPP